MRTNERNVQSCIITDLSSQNDNIKPFFEVYHLDPMLYSKTLFDGAMLSFHTQYLFSDKSIKYVGDLLLQTRDSLINNIGLGSNELIEVQKYLMHLSNGINNDPQTRDKNEIKFTDNNSEEKLKDIYNLDPELYENININQMVFSTRTKNGLLKADICRFCDLINISEDDLYSIRNLGRKSVNEIKEVLNNIQNNGEIDLSTVNIIDEQLSDQKLYDTYHKNPANYKGVRVSEVLLSDRTTHALEKSGINYISDLLMLTQNELLEIRGLGKKGFNDIRQFLDHIDEITSKYYTNIINYKESKEEIDQIIDRIPANRRSMKARWFINAYTTNESTRTFLFVLSSTTDGTLISLIDRIKDLQKDTLKQLLQFIAWCSFDIMNEIQIVKNNIFHNERIEQIINMRAHGEILEDIGSKYQLTRERIRQIINSSIKKASALENNYKIMLKIVAVRNGDYILTPDELHEYFGEDNDEFVFLLKSINSNTFYYNDSANVFVVGHTSLDQSIVRYIDNLPDVIYKSEIDTILNNAKDSENLPKEMLERAIKRSYKNSGNVFYRNRLSLTNVFSKILSKYFPDGIAVNDLSELMKFRKYVQEEYGDIQIPKNDHSLITAIARGSVLRDRSTYISKRTQYISEELTNQIHNYIRNYEKPIITVKYLYSLFKDNLMQYGIDNQYYFQGVLREIYGDELIISKDYIAKDSSGASIQKQITNYIRKSEYPISKQELYQAFPGITSLTVQFAIDSDNSILNYFGQYIFADKLDITDSDISYIQEHLDQIVADNQCHHEKEVFDVINTINPYLLHKLCIYYAYSLLSLIIYLFPDNYEYNRPYIAKKGINIDDAKFDLSTFATDYDCLTIRELFNYVNKKHIRYVSILEVVNSVNKTHLLLDKYTLASINSTGINEGVARDIEKLITDNLSDCKAIREMDCLRNINSQYPSIKVNCTDWLIYSIINKWGTNLQVTTTSTKFKNAIPVVYVKGAEIEKKLIEIKKYYEDKDLNSSSLNKPGEDIDDLIAECIEEEL